MPCQHCGSEEGNSVSWFSQGAKRSLVLLCKSCELPVETIDKKVAEALQGSGIAVPSVSEDYNRTRKKLRENLKSTVTDKYSHVKRVPQDRWNTWYRGKYRRGKEWESITRLIRARDCNTCQECGVTEQDSPFMLEVHHNTYYHMNRFGVTKPGDCTLLCPQCHDLRSLATNKDFDCVRYSHFSEERHEKSPFLGTREEIISYMKRLEEGHRGQVAVLSQMLEEKKDG